MKVVLPAILLLEAVVVGLAIPVALVVLGEGAAVGWALGTLSVLLVVGSAAVRRPHGVAIGWALQVLILLSGLLVPAMAAVGLIFLGVWVLGVIYGAKADVLAARNAAAEAAYAAEQARDGASGDPAAGD